MPHEARPKATSIPRPSPRLVSGCPIVADSTRRIAAGIRNGARRKRRTAASLLSPGYSALEGRVKGTSVDHPNRKAVDKPPQVNARPFLAGLTPAQGISMPVIFIRF
jgi:hypothetical protein